MSDGRAPATPPTSGIALLERAIGYTLGSLQLVTPESLAHPTPCPGWDLHALLHHMEDSLAALQEAVDHAGISLTPMDPIHGPGKAREPAEPPAGPDPRAPFAAGRSAGPDRPGPFAAVAPKAAPEGADGDAGREACAGELVSRLRDRACHLLGSWVGDGRREPVPIGGRTLPVSVLTSAGAVEIAIHGWDVARACGQPRPIPPRLAQELLVLASLLVRRADRPVRFAPPVTLPPEATPSDHLVAFLGRQPA
jgi:uncharacterized protein (TIGR03086 family)